MDIQPAKCKVEYFEIKLGVINSELKIANVNTQKVHTKVDTEMFFCTPFNLTSTEKKTLHQKNYDYVLILSFLNVINVTVLFLIHKASQIVNVSEENIHSLSRYKKAKK